MFFKKMPQFSKLFFTLFSFLIFSGNAWAQALPDLLEVSLSAETPQETNIPINSTSIPFMKLELAASYDADVLVSSLKFTRLGEGDNDDFDNVWLEIDGFKVGNDKSINNDDVVELRFNPPIVVPAGQTLVADIVASLKYQLASDGTCYSSGAEGCNIGHHNRLALVSAEDIVSTAANITGDFPIEGEEMEVADYRVSEIKFSRLGSDTTVYVGDSSILIGKFRMLNASTTNKDVELRAVTFKNDGTAELEDDLENVSLYVSGEQVSAETIIEGDYLTFRLENTITAHDIQGYIIEDGDSRIFSIRADIVSSEKGDVINFKVDNFEDIIGLEIGTGFGVKAIAGDANGTSFAESTTTVETATSCLNEDAEDSCARLRAYEIYSGGMSISRDPASLGNQNDAPGSHDMIFMTARVVVDQPVNVQGVRINVLEASNDEDGNLLDSLAELNAQFENFRLFLDDRLIATLDQFEGSFGSNGVGTFLNYEASIEISGNSVLKLVGDIKDGAPNESKIRMEVRSDAFDLPQFISTGEPVSEVQGSAQASFVEVEEPSLSIIRSDGLSNGGLIVAGVNDVTFLKFVLDNNDSGDVNATSVSIQAIGNGAATNYNRFTSAIFVDGIQQGSSRSLDNEGRATFNDLSVVIPSAGQIEFEVVTDTIESSASSQDLSSGSGIALWSDVGDVLASSNIRLAVTAVDADKVGNGQAVMVKEGGNELGSMVDESVSGKNENCDIDGAYEVVNREGGHINLSTRNYLCGVRFGLVHSGQLGIEAGSAIVNNSNILVANSEGVEVFKLRLSAKDDEIQVKDLYFINNGSADFDDRVDFKLYDEAGRKIQEKQMTGTRLHFELANQDRIRVPKNDSTIITIKVDVRAITKANQTGKTLKLALSTMDETSGVEAVTAATGSDLLGSDIVVFGTPKSEEFVAYRTMLTFARAARQPDFIPDMPGVGIYRFTATNDVAYEALFNKVTIGVETSSPSILDEAGGQVFDLVRMTSSAYSGSGTFIASSTMLPSTSTIYSGSGAFVPPSERTPNVKRIVFDDFSDEIDGTNYYEVRIKSSYTEDELGTDFITGRILARSTRPDTQLRASDVLGDIVWSDRSNNGSAGAFLNDYELINGDPSTVITVPEVAHLGLNDYEDIPQRSIPAVEELMDQGVITGTTYGYLLPNEPLTRREMMKWIVLGTGVDLETNNGPHFSDVQQSSAYYDFIETAYNMGWVFSSPNFILPEEFTSRGEFARTLINAFEIEQDLSSAPHFDDVPPSNKYYGYIETLYNTGCMNFYDGGEFFPDWIVTRVEAIEALYCTQLFKINNPLKIKKTVKLTVEESPRVSGGNILVANDGGVTVLKLKLSAKDAEVRVSDLYFENKGDRAFRDRAYFGLYDEYGTPIQFEQMADTRIHFKLEGQDRIRVPKDGSTIITIEVFTRANQTGKRMILALADNAGTGNKAVEAFRAATGVELEVNDITVVGTPTSKEYIAYRSKPKVRHSADQPKFKGLSDVFQEVYRFDISSKSYYNVDPERISLDIGMDGMFYSGSESGVSVSSKQYGAIASINQLEGSQSATEFQIVPVIDGNALCVGDDCTAIATASVVDFTKDKAVLSFDFLHRWVWMGEAKTYALLMKRTGEDQSTAEDQQIAVKILSDASYSAPLSTLEAKQKEGANFIWTDRSNNGNPGPWLNGYLVDIAKSTLINGATDKMYLFSNKFFVSEEADGASFVGKKLTLPSKKLKMQHKTNEQITVELPAGTVIEKEEDEGDDWDGSLEPPTTCLVPSIPGATVQSCMKTGHANMKLKLSKPAKVRIPFSGANGRKTVYTSQDGITWVPEFTCEVVDGFCEFETDHFTYFSVGSPTSIPTVTSTSYGGGGAPSHESTDVCIAGKMTRVYPHKTFGDEAYKTYNACRKTKSVCLANWAKAAGLSQSCDSVSVKKAESVVVKTSVASNKKDTSTCKSEKLSRKKSDTIPRKSPFVDVLDTNPLYESVLSLYLQGIVSGQGDSGMMNLSDPINRAELSKIVAMATEAEVFTSDDCNVTNFPDVPASKWFARYVRYMKAQGIINGYKNGKFGPENEVTYGQTLKIMARSFNLVSPETIEPGGSDWPKPYYESLSENGVLPTNLADSTDWNQAMTRGQMFEILSRVLSL